jgi:putative ABC transport system substrate-binding protein
MYSRKISPPESGITDFPPRNVLASGFSTGGKMRRRELIFVISGAFTWPIQAAAQAPRTPVIGFLDPGFSEPNRGQVAEFRQGLADAGYVEGKNIAFEFRWGNNRRARLEMLAAELVDLPISVLFASGGVGAALAAKAATSNIPIVVAGGADPVRYGLVASLNRPGGNVTGVTSLHNELAGKRLSLLRDMVPQVTTVGYLTGGARTDETAQELTEEMLAAAHALGLQVIVLECHEQRDFEAAFAKLVEQGAGALAVSAFPLAFNNRTRILALASRYKIPAIYPQLPYVFGGGLMGYSAVGVTRQASSYYIPRILQGAKPADLPVQQPTRFRLIINLKTANALGLSVPTTLLTIADQVIE